MALAYHQGVKPDPLPRSLPGRSTVGLKAAAAVSGALLAAWVVAHLLGNLTLFAGAAAADGYAAMLRRAGGLLWLARAGTLAAAVVHVWAVVSLARRAPRRARLVHLGPGRSATLASRSMRLGGALLALFVVYHLLHLTTGTAHPDFVPGGVHHNVVRGLGVPLVAALYLVACGLLGLHLGHGLWSLWASLGLRPDRDPRRRQRLAVLTGTVVAALFASIPAAVLLGVLP
jgi:succinate dehydrogenase / fumarate reductase, cytochrome b subunit